jgi:hypothetical protein
LIRSLVVLIKAKDLAVDRRTPVRRHERPAPSDRTIAMSFASTRHDGVTCDKRSHGIDRRSAPLQPIDFAAVLIAARM